MPTENTQYPLPASVWRKICHPNETVTSQPVLKTTGLAGNIPAIPQDHKAATMKFRSERQPG